MSRWISGVLGIAVLFLGSFSHAFCVQTFNAFGPIYAKEITERTELLSEELLNSGCDLIHLQEVWNGSQQNILSKKLVSKFEVSAPNRRMKIGLMAFSSAKILGESVQAFRLNTESFGDRLRRWMGVKKGFQSLRIQSPDLPTDIRSTNVHTHPESRHLRLTQILDLYQWRMQNQDLPWILTGDFNFLQNSQERDLLVHLLGLVDVHEKHLGGYGSECTYCDENKWVEEKGTDYVLDYIFVSGLSEYRAWKWDVLDAKINLRGSSARPLSDHYGVRAEMSLYSEGELNMQTPPEDKVQAHGKRLHLAQQILEKARDSRFDSDVRLLKEIQKQLQQKAGPHWEFFLKNENLMKESL